MSKRKMDQAQKDDLMKQLNVGKIVSVESFDKDKMTVNVQPLSKWENDGAFETPPQIQSVPIFCFCGGGFILRPWYEKGDVGIVVFIDHDIDNTMIKGKITQPNTNRQHSSQDAVFIGGIAYNSLSIKGIPDETIALSTINGETYIALKKDKILIKGDVEIDGNVQLKDMKSTSVSSYNNHSHSDVQSGSNTTGLPK